MVPEAAPGLTKLDTWVKGGPGARPKRAAPKPGPDERTKDVRRNYLALTELKRARRTMKVPPPVGPERERAKKMRTSSVNDEERSQTTRSTAATTMALTGTERPTGADPCPSP